MINNTIAEINEPSQTEVTSTDLLNLNFFNEFDMQILQIQSEVAYKVSTRQNRAKLLKHEIDAELEEFETRWFEEISEAASMDLKSLKHGIRVYGYEGEGSKFSVNKNTSTIALKYIMNSFEFDLERCDEFEDIDVNDFMLRSYRIDKDELMKINIVFSELESLIPYLVRWNRELESLQSDMQIKVMQINFELVDLDDEIKQLRQSIHDIRSASFLAGNVVDFNDKKTRRMYYGSRKFEFIDQVRLLKLSPTGKTCTFEAITLKKGFQSTYYFPLDKTQYTKTYDRVRVSTLLNNFYEMK